MYAKGMSTRDIQHPVKEIYNHDISPETVSRITDAVIDKAKEWQNRPLEPIYAIVFMDALFLKLRGGWPGQKRCGLSDVRHRPGGTKGVSRHLAWPKGICQQPT